MLREAIIQNEMPLKFCVLSLVTATAMLLTFLSVPSLALNQLSAQITPSFNPEPADFRIGFMAQDSADPVQNGTSANITQLATVLPVANQPITPASYTPVIEETENSDSASSKDDDDNSASSSSDNDDGDDNGDDSDNDSGDNSDNDSGDDNRDGSDESENDNGDDSENDNGDDDGDGGGSFAFAGGGGAFAFAG
jgi:type IV secretory pathway VirB10-like protein